jgi:hypothetical protein
MSLDTPESTDNTNSAKGRSSYDSSSSGALVQFFNRNVTPYPTEVGGPKFDLVPVEKQKDIMLNVARLHAKQEYDRIMELVSVLQRQAEQIKRRLDITDQVHAAEYQFQLYHNHCYWLAFHKRKNKTVLCHHGPYDSLVTEDHEYIARVKWLGDHTWIEVDDNDNPVW